MPRDYVDQLTLNTPPGLPPELQASGKIQFFPVGGDPSGILVGAVGDRAWQVGSTNSWVCTGGTTWIADTGGALGGNRTTFRVQPGGTADPALGLYTTWAACHAAAAAVAANDLVTIIIDSDNEAVVVPAGTFDMKNIQLIGYVAFQETALARAFLETSEDTVFTNWTRGAPYIQLTHNGSEPLFVIAPSETNALVSTGTYATYQSNGTAPIWRVTDAKNLTMIVDPFTELIDDNHEVLQVGAGSTATLLVISQVLVEADTLRGAGDIVITNNGLESTISTTQTNLSGSLTVSTYDQPYTPAVGANWVNPDPTGVASALDRLAAVVATLNGGPIP